GPEGPVEQDRVAPLEHPHALRAYVPNSRHIAERPAGAFIDEPDPDCCFIRARRETQVCGGLPGNPRDLDRDSRRLAAYADERRPAAAFQPLPFALTRNHEERPEDRVSSDDPS